MKILWHGPCMRTCTRARTSSNHEGGACSGNGTRKKNEAKTSMISSTYGIQSIFFQLSLPAPLVIPDAVLSFLMSAGETPRSKQDKLFQISNKTMGANSNQPTNLQGEGIPRRKPGGRPRPPMTTRGRTLSPAESHKRSQATPRERKPATAGTRVSDSRSEGRSVVDFWPRGQQSPKPNR